MFLGIDIGTSTVKALLADEAGCVVAQSSVPLEISRPHPQWSEQNPDDWWRATVAAVRQLPAAKRRAVRAIGLSGQMHGATLLDRADQPLRAAILWNDGRSGAHCRDLEARAPRLRQVTGNAAMPGFTAPKLLWVREHEPEIFERISTVLLPKDFVRLRLTGERCTDASDASGTLWLDVAERCWSETMLEATHLGIAQMPRVLEGPQVSGTLTPHSAGELGVPVAAVAAGAGDNAASAVGLGVIRPGEAFLSLGTSGVLFVVTDRFRPNPERGTHAFCHCLPNTWHQMAVLLSAGGALQWAAGVTGFADVPVAVAAAEQRALTAHTPVFLPYLTGERTPHNDPYARGVFFGLGPDTERADLVMGAMVGVALAFSDGLDALREAGSQLSDVCLCGGGARLDAWARLIASALGVPVTRRAGGEMGAALGAARLAQAAAEGTTYFPMPALERTFEPDRALREQLSERRRLFQKLYADLAPIFREYQP